MSDWMRELAEHYAAARNRYPWSDLMIVFDIDGTILDMRQMVWHVLLEYDRTHGSEFFYGLRVEDVDVHERRGRRTRTTGRGRGREIEDALLARTFCSQERSGHHLHGRGA